MVSRTQSVSGPLPSTGSNFSNEEKPKALKRRASSSQLTTLKARSSKANSFIEEANNGQPEDNPPYVSSPTLASLPAVPQSSSTASIRSKESQLEGKQDIIQQKDPTPIATDFKNISNLSISLRSKQKTEEVSSKSTPRTLSDYFELKRKYPYSRPLFQQKLG